MEIMNILLCLVWLFVFVLHCFVCSYKWTYIMQVSLIKPSMTAQDISLKNFFELWNGWEKLAGSKTFYFHFLNFRADFFFFPSGPKCIFKYIVGLLEFANRENFRITLLVCLYHGDDCHWVSSGNWRLNSAKTDHSTSLLIKNWPKSRKIEK